ncbi:MAG: VOC family protein [Pseudomonadales bacterium]
MKALNLVLIVLLVLPVAARAQQEEMGLGLYVVVSDLESSRSFYQSVFGKAPYFENESFTAFNVGGGLFGIFQEQAFTHELVRGNSSVPYIRVADIDVEFARIKNLGTELVHDEVVVEGPISLFMFVDPDGNPIEFYSLN